MLSSQLRHLGSQQQVLVETVLSEIQEPVLQTHLLGILEFLVDREGKLVGFGLDMELLTFDLDLSCREIGINGFRFASDHASRKGDDTFQPEVFREVEKILVWVDDDLGEAVVVTEIVEQDPSMVSFTVNPAGKFDRLADMVFAEFAAGMCPKRVHQKVSFKNGPKNAAP